MNASVLLRLAATPVLLLIALWLQLSHWDWIVVDHFYDYVDARFPLRGLWWTDGLLHDGGALIVTLIGVGALFGWLASYRVERLQRYRGDLAYVFACIALTTGLIAIIKSVSGIHCPVELTRYGGRFGYETLIDHLLQPLHEHGRAGACFPGGHSSGAFAMFAFYFLALHHRRRYATRVLMLVVLSGFMFALTQWMRGSHFPSHDLSTAAIAWAICVLLAAMRRPVARDVATDTHGLRSATPILNAT
jgi:membrane-associated PAP2 superfamily phosphatase